MNSQNNSPLGRVDNSKLVDEKNLALKSYITTVSTRESININLDVLIG